MQTADSTFAQQHKWYALYTFPRAEKKVKAALDRKCIENYLPLQKTLKQWSDRKKWVYEPLFKSYIFVRIRYETDHIQTLNTPGVVKFVKIGGETISIRESQINDIKLGLEQTHDIQLSFDKVETGVEVEIIAGPLKGKSGIVTERKGNKYFHIEIEQLGTTMFIAIPSAYLKVLT